MSEVSFETAEIGFGSDRRFIGKHSDAKIQNNENMTSLRCNCRKISCKGSNAACC